MKKVFVIEDQVILRDFLIRLVSGTQGFEFLGCAGDGHDAYQECLKLKPNILILDIMLPGLNGVEVLRRLKREIPGIMVLGFSAFPNKSILRDVVEAGADGLVQKSESLEILEKALRQVGEGQTFFSPNVVGMLRDIMLHPEQVNSLDQLSSREREVLQLIAESYSNKDIAKKLGISVKTAETHRNNIMRKLNIHDAVGLARYAIEVGLVTTENS